MKLKNYSKIGDRKFSSKPRTGLVKDVKTKDNLQYGLCHIVALPFTLKRILRQKKNYGNSNAKNIIFKKPSKRNQNPSRYYYNSIITNLKFQHKPKKYHLSKILI